MARIIFCLTLLLQACASHVVRCDAHLQPINAPAAAGNASHPTTAVAPARRTP
jgi:hypothetical protein